MAAPESEEIISFSKNSFRNQDIINQSDEEMEDEDNGYMSCEEESKHQSTPNNASEAKETRWSKENDKKLYAIYRNK